MRLARCDCVVSLHRSEGFGLVPAEAMNFGKPVIMTNWSGNKDYMSRDNSIGIDYQLVRLAKDYGPYKAGQYWAEPDVEQAAYWMKKSFSGSGTGHGAGRSWSANDKISILASCGWSTNQGAAGANQSTNMNRSNQLEATR